MVTLNGELQLNTYGSEIASKGFSTTGGELFIYFLQLYTDLCLFQVNNHVIKYLLQCNTLLITAYY